MRITSTETDCCIGVPECLLEKGCAVNAVLGIVSVCIRHIWTIFLLRLHFSKVLEVGHISVAVRPCYR